MYICVWHIGWRRKLLKYSVDWMWRKIYSVAEKRTMTMQANNKIHPLKVKRFKNLTEKDLNWSLGIFVSWMRIIGIDPNIPKTKDLRWFVWFIQRWTCFFLSTGVNIFTLWVHQTMRNDTENKTSSTLLWNEWIDYVSCSFHSISTHLCLLIFVTPNWNDLTAATNHVEYSLIGSPSVYNRVRKIAPFAIMVVIFMVLLNLFRLSKFIKR